jgi:hypothetical protein
MIKQYALEAVYYSAPLLMAIILAVTVVCFMWLAIMALDKRF